MLAHVNASNFTFNILKKNTYTSLSVHAVARARERKREREDFFSLKRANTFEWTISSVSNGRKAMKGNQRNLQFYLACCQTTFYLHFTPWKCKNCATFQRKLCIFLPKLFWPTVRKNCSGDREKLLKFEAEGREFSKILRSLEQFIQTVKGQNNFW